VFQADGGRTHVASARAAAPLKILAPRNHGDARWTFVATYGGGLVDGDAIALDVRVDAGARALLGTQASTKVYRGASTQTLTADVGPDALLVVMPDPLTPFAGARYEQRSTLRLAPGASLVWVDALSCGRAARGERWAFSRFESRTEIVVHGELVAHDALVLDASEQDIGRAMGRFDAFATVLIVNAELGAPMQGDVVWAPCPRAWGTCVRAAAPSTAALSSFLRELLAPVRDSLGDDPFARKW